MKPNNFTFYPFPFHASLFVPASGGQEKPFFTKRTQSSHLLYISLRYGLNRLLLIMPNEPNFQKSGQPVSLDMIRTYNEN
jgi:hypothetical protein